MEFKKIYINETFALLIFSTVSCCTCFKYYFVIMQIMAVQEAQLSLDVKFRRKNNIETIFNVEKKNVDLNKNLVDIFFMLSVPMYTEATINHSLKHKISTSANTKLIVLIFSFLFI